MLRYVNLCLLTLVCCSPVFSQETNPNLPAREETAQELTDLDPKIDHVVTFSIFDRVNSASVAPQVRLGVNVQKPHDTLMKQLSLPRGIGLVVANVIEGTSAKAAEVEPHDILLKFDDQWLVNEEQLRTLVGMRQAGDSVILTIVRESQRREIEVVLKASKVASQLPQSLKVDRISFDHAKMSQGQNCAACHMNASDLSQRWEFRLDGVTAEDKRDD